MPLFRKGSSTELARKPAGKSGAAVDRESLLRHLEEERWRSTRYKRPLAVVCFAPRMLTDERLTSTERKAAIEALRTSTRRSDMYAEVSDSVYAAVLPETDDAEANAVASRLRSELSLRRTGTRQINWLVGAAPLTSEETAEALLVAALESMHA